MKLNALHKEVLAWFDHEFNREKPFTTGEIFDALKSCNDRTELSNAMRQLYFGGYLSRKKLDNVRYQYATVPGPEGFEIHVSEPEDNAGKDENHPWRAAGKGIGKIADKPGNEFEIPSLIAAKSIPAGGGEILPKVDIAEDSIDHVDTPVNSVKIDLPSCINVILKMGDITITINNTAGAACA